MYRFPLSFLQSIHVLQGKISGTNHFEISFTTGYLTFFTIHLIKSDLNYDYNYISH